jgi:hypothetical protein
MLFRDRRGFSSDRPAFRFVPKGIERLRKNAEKAVRYSVNVYHADKTDLLDRFIQTGITRRLGRRQIAQSRFLDERAKN